MNNVIERYRKRRQARLDARGYRAEEEGRWITTENNHKARLNKKGEPDKGNKHVVDLMKEGNNGPKVRMSLSANNVLR